MQLFYAALRILPDVYLADDDAFATLTRDPDGVAYFTNEASCFMGVSRFCNQMQAHPMSPNNFIIGSINSEFLTCERNPRE